LNTTCGCARQAIRLIAIDFEPASTGALRPTQRALIFQPSPMNLNHHRLELVVYTGLLCGAVWPCQALDIRITPGPAQIYLQVGEGQYNLTPSTPDHRSNATPAINPLVNLVSVTVPPSALGRGTAIKMNSDSTFEFSFFDRSRPNRIKTCTAGSEVYIGAWSRNPGVPTLAQLSVSAPPFLSNGTEQISFDAISWSSTAGGDPTEHIAAGRFVPGGSLPLATIPANHWFENCHVFSYRNDVLLAPGIYRGRATYTLSTP